MASGVIGTMAGFDHNKRTIRQRPNPLDKATIVSIYPKAIKEVKHTIQPSIFEIAPGTEQTPALLVVGPSSWWTDTGSNMLEIPNGAIQIAESVVTDYCNGLPGITEDAYPGLFYVPGEEDIENIRKKYKNALAEAVRKQKNWFNNLIREADSEWARTNGSPRAVSELMKMAAHALNMADRPWMKTSVDALKIPCVACGHLRNPEYPICPSCNMVVDQVLASKLGITAK